MSLWVWPVFGLGALAALRWVLYRPIHRRHRTLADARRLVDSFLRQMDTGAVWLAKREAGPGFLQLALVANQPFQQCVELGVPDVDWSQDHFDQVRKSIQAAGFTVELQTSATDPVRRFLRVRCSGQRPELTQTALRLLEVAAEALGWDQDETYTVHWGGSRTGPQAWREILDGLDRVPDGAMQRRLRRYASRQLGRRDE